MSKKNKSIEFEKFFKNYILTLSNVIDKINLDKLYEAANLILNTIKKKNFIYVCGNGGSAAIANHYICDYFKGLSKFTNLKAKIKSFQAIYPLTAGITQKIMRRSVNSALCLLPELDEWIDPSLKKSRSWPEWKLALKLVHDPSSYEAVAPSFPARERLSYDELYAH